MSSTQVQAPFSVQQPSHLGQDMRYYIVRPGNIMIPLIPVDQLPFQLQGVPRQLNHQQMFDGGWKFLQETKEFPQSLPVQAPAQVPSSQSRFLSPDHTVRETIGAPNTTINSVKVQNTAPWLSQHNAKTAFDESLPIRRAPTTMADRLMASQHIPSNNFLADKWRQPQESNSRRSTSPAMPTHPISLSDSFAKIYQKDAQRYNYQTLPPSGVEPDPSKKEFCTHWIKTGECAFTATGCRYKHEMPEPQKLRELGFTSQPKWWKDKSAIRSLTWMQRRVNKENDEESDQTASPPTRRVFNPSTFREITREHGEPQQGLAVLKSLEPRTERGILSKSSEREVLDSLKSYSKAQRIPNLIDIDEIRIPAPPPSLQPSTSASSDFGSADDSSSSRSSVSHSPPASPSLDVVLASLQDTTDETPRCVRSHSEISWSSNDGKLHEQYTRRNAPLKKSPAPRAVLTSVTSRTAGLAKSRYASKTKEGDDAIQKDGHGKKGGKEPLIARAKKTNKEVPRLEAQITKLVRTVGDRDRERRRKTTAGQTKEAILATPVTRASALS